MALATLGVTNNAASTQNIVGVSILPRQLPSQPHGAVPGNYPLHAPPVHSEPTPVAPASGPVVAAGAASTPIDVTAGPYAVVVAFADGTVQRKEVVVAAANVVVDFTG